jgi:hypothetical protein
MYINDVGHVHFSGLTEYSSFDDSRTWYETYSSGLSPASSARCLRWIEAKRKYEEAKANGQVKITVTSEQIV